MTIVSPAAMAKLAIDRASIVSCKKNREIFIPNREIGRFSLFHQKSGDLPQNRETWKLCILLKCFAPSIIKPLTLIINQIMKTGVFPNKMKLAKVIPIYKKDDPTQVTNYRPMSLLPVLSKVVEKTIAKQLSEYFEENKINTVLERVIQQNMLL